jgi:hypothetical protein
MERKDKLLTSFDNNMPTAPLHPEGVAHKILRSRQLPGNEVAILQNYRLGFHLQ